LSDALLVTVAGIGAEVDRARQPNLPLLPEEVGEEYRRAYEAGATIGHIHGRRPDGTPKQDRETWPCTRSPATDRNRPVGTGSRQPARCVLRSRRDRHRYAGGFRMRF